MQDCSNSSVLAMELLQSCTKPSISSCQASIPKACNGVSMTNLTHWGRVTHICVSKLAIIGSDNGLSPGRRQAIIWTNAGILLIRILGTNFSEILSEIRAFSFKKMRLKMASAKWRRLCLSLNELMPPRIVRLTVWLFYFAVCFLKATRKLRSAWLANELRWPSS